MSGWIQATMQQNTISELLTNIFFEITIVTVFLKQTLVDAYKFMLHFHNGLL